MEGENGLVPASKPLHLLSVSRGPPPLGSTNRLLLFQPTQSSVTSVLTRYFSFVDPLTHLPQPYCLPLGWGVWLAAPLSFHLPPQRNTCHNESTCWVACFDPTFFAQPRLTHRTVREPYSTLPLSLPPRREQSYQMSEYSHIP